MKQILHPYVKCYECSNTGSILVEENPDCGPIVESCSACTEARREQAEQIIADALLHYGTKVDLEANRADVLWAGTSLGWVERVGASSGRQYRGWIEFAGETIPATRNTGEQDAHGWALQSVFATHDEAARAVVLTARNYRKIG